MAVESQGRVQGESGRESHRSVRQQSLRATAIAKPSYAAGARTRRGMLCFKKRHGKMELRSLTHFAIHPKAAAMHLDEMFGDGQTETRASGFARAGDINTVEAFKNARLVSLGDADAGI